MLSLRACVQDPPTAFRRGVLEPLDALYKGMKAQTIFITTHTLLHKHVIDRLGLVCLHLTIPNDFFFLMGKFVFCLSFREEDHY